MGPGYLWYMSSWSYPIPLLDKIAAFLRTIFLDAFSWMKSFVLWLKFHLSLFLRVQLAKIQHWFSNGLVPNRLQAIFWTNVDMIHWRIYAALSEYETVLNTYFCYTINLPIQIYGLGTWIISFDTVNHFRSSKILPTIKHSLASNQWGEYVFHRC